MDTDGSIRTLGAAMNLPRVILTMADGDPSSLATAADALSADPPPSRVLGLVILFVIFVICGAYFGGAESAFSAMNRIRIKAKADDGDRLAKNAMFIASNFDRALTTLLIGNNVTHIAAASVATVIATRLFGASDRVTFI